MRVIERSTDDWMNSFLYSPDGLRDNAKLYIVVRTYLRQINPPGSIGTYNDGSATVDIVPWDEPSWLAFKEALVSTVDTHWNNKFWLVPDRAWPMEKRVGDYVYRPNIRCYFNLRLTSSPQSAHVNVACRRLAPAETFSRSNSVVPRDAMRLYRINSTNQSTIGINLDNLDVTPRAGGQVPAVHELGHYIGLDHVNYNVPGQDEYGHTAHQRDDIMGAGARFEAWHSHPWCRRLRLHLSGIHPAATVWDTSGGGNTLRWLTGMNDERVVWEVHTSHVEARCMQVA